MLKIFMNKLSCSYDCRNPFNILISTRFYHKSHSQKSISVEYRKSLQNRLINRKMSSTSKEIPSKIKEIPPTVPKTGCGPIEEDEEDMEEMFIQGPVGLEWGGPTRGGRRPEPTRYGDWERKGRATDF